jgi:hypothetical protein
MIDVMTLHYNTGVFWGSICSFNSLHIADFFSGYMGMLLEMAWHGMAWRGVERGCGIYRWGG